MERTEKIESLDLMLARHRGLLSDGEENEYLRLLTEVRETSTAEGEEGEPLPLRLLILGKQLELLVYDSSPEINSFFLNGVPDWRGPFERANLRNAVDALVDAGVETADFMGYHIPTDMAQAALKEIELYAAGCTAVRDTHMAAIAELQSERDIDRYDFTVGYPPRPEFQI